eukprot:2212673-Pyramimonas_sp.AAC.1
MALENPPPYHNICRGDRRGETHVGWAWPEGLCRVPLGVWSCYRANLPYYLRGDLQASGARLDFGTLRRGSFQSDLSLLGAHAVAACALHVASWQCESLPAGFSIAACWLTSATHPDIDTGGTYDGPMMDMRGG